MPRINHDKLFKELLTTFFVEFLELFFPRVLDYLDTDSIQFIDKEIFSDLSQGEKSILDIVALAKFQGQDYSFLIHIENQSSNAPEFNRRMFRYFCSLFLKYDRPITRSLYSLMTHHKDQKRIVLLWNFLLLRSQNSTIR